MPTDQHSPAPSRAPIRRPPRGCTAWHARHVAAAQPKPRRAPQTCRARKPAQGPRLPQGCRRAHGGGRQSAGNEGARATSWCSLNACAMSGRTSVHSADARRSRKGSSRSSSASPSSSYQLSIGMPLASWNPNACAALSTAQQLTTHHNDVVRAATSSLQNATHHTTVTAQTGTSPL